MKVQYISFVVHVMKISCKEWKCANPTNDTSEIIIKSHRRARACRSIFSRHSSLLECNLVSARREKVIRSLVRENHHIFRVSLIPSPFLSAPREPLPVTRSQRWAELVHYVRFIRTMSLLVPVTQSYAHVEQESCSMKRASLFVQLPLSPRHWRETYKRYSRHTRTISMERRIPSENIPSGAESSNQNSRNFNQ